MGIVLDLVSKQSLVPISHLEVISELKLSLPHPAMQLRLGAVYAVLLLNTTENCHSR